MLPKTDENQNFNIGQLRSMGTRTLFEWYRNETKNKTHTDAKNSALLRAAEREIERRLREMEQDKKEDNPFIDRQE